eukprot:gene35218-biopygen27838
MTPTKSCFVKCSFTTDSIHSIYRRSSIEKKLNYFEVPLESCEGKCSATIASIQSIYRRPSIKETSNYFEMSTGSCSVKCSATIVSINSIYFHSLIQKKLYNFNSSTTSGTVKGVTIYRCSSFQKELNNFFRNIAFSGGDLQKRFTIWTNTIHWHSSVEKKI